MSEKLSEVSSLLEKYGGHPMAAGFSLKRGNIEAFRKALNEHAALKEEDLQEKLWIDVPMPLDYISEELIHDFEKLEPFGTGNERPLFATKGLTITGMRVLGRNQNVVRLDLRTPNGKLLPGILFTDGAAFRQSLGGRSHITIAYYPEINEYNGTKTIQAVIEDYRLEP